MSTPPTIAGTKPDIRGIFLKDLEQALKDCGEQSFRARQIFEWIYKKGATSFGQMTNVPNSLRQSLAEKFLLFSPEIAAGQFSSDGTKKFLFSMADGEKVETVLIPTATRATVCVSTQAGCKFGCKFCASGIGGWTRNLSAAEILTEVLYAKSQCQALGSQRATGLDAGAPARAQSHPLSHIVFMGTGEPLDNYENLLMAIRLINAPEGLGIAARRITVSTCGVIPGILRLAGERLQIELAISLHGYNDESRKVLMPVNKKYPMKDLIPACREYIKKTKRQITFEYILIQNLTCSPEAVKELALLFRGMICKMNLIPYNPVSEFDHKTPTRQEMLDFQKNLEAKGIHATIRTPRGRDVSAACGQLRHALPTAVAKAT